MITKILKWFFLKYNNKLVNPSFFQGSLNLKGLKNQVNIYRDKWHIPHIYAKNNNDMFFAQGFIHAQDRLWQMELNRRIACGKLSEAFGKIALETDKLTRTLGFERMAEEELNAMDEKTLSYLNSYINGINEYIANYNYPVEFFITKIKLKKWKLTDVIAWSRVMAWTLSHGWSGSLIRTEIIKQVGEEKAKELEIIYPNDNPFELPNGIEFNKLTESEMLASFAGPFLFKDMEGGGKGSNMWVISGKYTDSGSPILANDTHLALKEPSIWYINHLFSQENYHVGGVSLPGVLGIMIGHNDKIAWGVTLSYTDGEDLFLEKIHPDKPLQYEYKNKWKNMDVISETINIKGDRKPYAHTIKETIHGPIISDIINYKEGCVSFCSISLKSSQIIQSFIDLNQVDRWNKFIKIAQKIKSPPLNISYADKKGNIGMCVVGDVPIRGKGKGQYLSPGWTGDYDWIGIVPKEKMPYIFNPESGIIISTNNKPVSDEYEYFLGNSFMNGYRAKRIKQILSESSIINVDLCKKIQFDIFSIPGQKMQQGFVGFQTVRPKAKKVLDVLLKWDCILDTKSSGGIVYEVLLYKMLVNLVKDDMDEELMYKWLGNGSNSVLVPENELLGHASIALFNILENPKSLWLSNSSDAIKFMEKSLIDTCKWLENKFGEDISLWEWGKIHQVGFNHALGLTKPLDKILNLGPYDYSGDTDTVCQSAYNPSTPFSANSWCPALRMIISLDDFNKMQIINPPGQSGIFGSKYYDDSIAPWLNGKYYNLYWDVKEIEKENITKLIMIPK